MSAKEIMHDNVTLAGLGLGVEEAMGYLFHANPGFAEFEQWVLAVNGGMIAPEKIERINAAIRGAGPAPAQRKVILDIESAPPAARPPAMKPPARMVRQTGPRVTGRRLATRTGTASKAAWLANITNNHNQ